MDENTQMKSSPLYRTAVHVHAGVGPAWASAVCPGRRVELRVPKMQRSGTDQQGRAAPQVRCPDITCTAGIMISHWH